MIPHVGVDREFENRGNGSNKPVDIHGKTTIERKT